MILTLRISSSHFTTAMSYGTLSKLTNLYRNLLSSFPYRLLDSELGLNYQSTLLQSLSRVLTINLSGITGQLNMKYWYKNKIVEIKTLPNGGVKVFDTSKTDSYGKYKAIAEFQNTDIAIESMELLPAFKPSTTIPKQEIFDAIGYNKSHE